MNKIKTIAGQILVTMIPLGYLYFIWNTLPENVPTHFNGHFEADKFGTKSDILTALLIMALVSIGLSLLINNLNAIDPKKRYPDENSLMTKISWTIVIFISLLLLIIVYTTKNYGQADISSFFHKSIFILVALIFTVLGKFMANLKPNYFIGMLHGLLFLTYLVLLLQVATENKWSLKKIFLSFIAALLPFGTFYAAKTLYPAETVPTKI